jgi:hypothetical protein
MVVEVLDLEEEVMVVTAMVGVVAVVARELHQ